MDGPPRNSGDSPVDAFGARLRRAREAVGLAQEELAARAGLSRNVVGGLERGEHRHPYPATVRALAAALGLTDAERALLGAAVPKRVRGTSANVTRPDLPAPLASLVGREREVAEVCSLLRQEAGRLVTLTGPGGVGKTRLALQVAADLAGDFAHGAAFVSLAAVRAPALVAPTVAHALGIIEGGGRPAPDRLGDALRARHLLLVLDNFEQVLEAAPLATDLLGRCPRLTILATSRAGLRLDGEQVFPVPPLTVPDPEHLPAVEQLAEIAAVRLFVDRARAGDPAFALTDGNAGAVAAVCHRLDGLPLAIELAAARSSTFAPEALLPRLARRLPLLTGGRRDAPARHRTMRDAIAWSHDLLTAEEQALFRRLAVFVGGCTLEAAEAVAGVGDRGAAVREPDDVSSPPPPVVDGIAALVDASLLRTTGSTDAPRCLMLETVREYARERLAASGEEPAIRTRHAAWCLRLAEEAEPALRGPDQFAWLDRLEAEVFNLRAGLAWLGDTGDAERGLRLAAALWTFWIVRDRVPEGRRWLETFLAAGPVGAGWRAKALVALGDLVERQGDHAAAADRLDEAAVLARERGDPAGEAAALRGRGNAAISHGEAVRHRLGDEAGAEAEFARAEALLTRSLDLARGVGDAWGAAKATHWLGIVALERRDHGRASAALAEALADFQRLGDHRQICMVVGNLGAVAEQAGDLVRARAALAESLALAWRLGYRWWVGWCLDNLARVATATGEGARAARLIGAAAALRPASGEPVRSGLERVQGELVGTIRLALGEDATTAALEAGAALPLDEAVAEALALGGTDPAASSPVAGVLTAREREVLRLLVEGRSNAEIADALFVGVRTARAHVASILAKLGVATRTAAATRAIRDGLV
jgi:predicted ATPase/DNA-binding CsgD family transcriptional regulator/DNA-binding XRE family transcriptional regulator